MPAFDGLGKALRWLREKKGTRQYQVAEDAGITKAMLSAYETGKQRPSLETLEKILDALGIDLADLSSYLDLVNERDVPQRREGGTDVKSILGVDRLPPEEEEALGLMLDGFHRFVRYLHRTLEQGAAASGES